MADWTSTAQWRPVRVYMHLTTKPQRPCEFDMEEVVTPPYSCKLQYVIEFSICVCRVIKIHDITYMSRFWSYYCLTICISRGEGSRLFPVLVWESIYVYIYPFFTSAFVLCYVLFYFDILYFNHTLDPSPSAGRARGLKGSTHLSPVHALNFGLADWVSTPPAPRQLSTLS